MPRNARPESPVWRLRIHMPMYLAVRGREATPMWEQMEDPVHMDKYKMDKMEKADKTDKTDKTGPDHMGKMLHIRKTVVHTDKMGLVLPMIEELVVPPMVMELVVLRIILEGARRVRTHKPRQIPQIPEMIQTAARMLVPRLWALPLRRPIKPEAPAMPTQSR